MINEWNLTEMPSAKDGIGVSSGQTFGSAPPPVPTCPPPDDADLNANGNGFQVILCVFT